MWWAVLMSDPRMHIQTLLYIFRFSDSSFEVTRRRSISYVCSCYVTRQSYAVFQFVNFASRAWFFLPSLYIFGWNMVMHAEWAAIPDALSKVRSHGSLHSNVPCSPLCWERQLQVRCVTCSTLGITWRHILSFMPFIYHLAMMQAV